MDSARDKKAVMDAFVKALKDDRSRTKISSISALGLIEMTRKRTGETVDTAMTEICPYCHGLRAAWTPPKPCLWKSSVSCENLLRRASHEAFVVSAHPDVCAHLIGAQGEDIEELERQLRRSIYVRAVPSWHHIEKFDIDQGGLQKFEQPLAPPRRGQVVEVQVGRDDPHSDRAPWATGHLLPQRAYQVELTNGARYQGQTVKVRLTDVRRSVAIGDVLPTGKIQGNERQGSGERQTAENGRSGGSRERAAA